MNKESIKVMNKESINFIIIQHNNAMLNIVELEKSCAEIKVVDDKTKAQFGNFCVALRGYRMVADATEAILMNEDILKGEDGCFYKKVEESVRVPENSGKGSDFDLDKKENKDE